ncbi:DUF1642 domain-containing protein [Lactococcus formosensis]|uniref:DUF1642 domain-containing protein n=1 Tax=Lactococcus formosensis TaxID=1281486 RepID=UPI002096CDB2|nr:DUF1642 domain-containing protein [Lactococcus formosensis]MCO7180424.1 DUF1642 domain-containing protein [Lactococcus formosensis]
MKKFEEELKSGPVSIGQDTITHEYAYDEGTLINYFKDWVSQEDHQQVAKALGNTTDKLDCAEERVGLLEKTVDQLKSQLDKQQPEIPEVPQFVADWYEENKGSLDYMIFETCRDLTDESTNEFENWFGYDENKAITTLVNMKNGYTVAKEKRFYLKHIDFCKRDKDYDWYMIKHSDGPLNHLRVEKETLPPTVDTYFTQQEIDSMAAESYEQIEVEE